MTPPDRGPSRGSPARRPAGVVVGVLAWILACGPLTAWLLWDTHSAWAAMGVYHAGCLVAGMRFAEAGRRPRWTGLLIGAIATTSVMVAAGIPLLTWLQDSRLPMTRWKAWGLGPPGDVGILTYYVVMNPWVEERFWRGAVAGPRFRQVVGSRASFFGSVFAFWLFHVFVLCLAFGFVLGFVTSLFVLVAAWAWTVVRIRTGNVWWCMVTHLGADLGLAILYFTMLRDRT